MPKLSKNSVIVITLSVVSLVLGGTFFVISQNKSGQNLTSNSSNSSSSISSQSSSSAISTNQSPYLGGAVGGGSSSQNQSQNPTISSQSNSINPQQSSNSSVSTSQSTSSNPKIQPLVADETHDVVVLEECDLAVRFPKKLGEINIGIFRRAEDSQKSIRIGNEEISNADITKPFIMNSLISCDNEIYLQTLNAQKDLGKPEFTQDIKYEDLVKDTKGNWNLPNITDIQGFSGGSIYSIRTYFFKSQSKNYLIDQTNGSDNPNKLGIYIDQIKIQFNSLAPSTPSVKLGNRS